MPSVNGIPTNAVVYPVEYVETGTGGDFGAAPVGDWEDVGSPIPVVLVPMGIEEKTLAGIDKDTLARELYYNLSDGNITTKTTLRIEANRIPPDARFDVKADDPYEVSGFPEVGIVTVVKQ